MIGFDVKINDVKKLFFDRKVVMDAEERATIKALSKFGAKVRTRDRQSIKPAPKKASTRAKRGITADGTSSPGNPPVSHGEGLLRKWILFAYEPARRSVIIGAALLSGHIGNAPAALELGGESEAFDGIGPKRKKVRTTVEARPHTRPAFEAELPGVDRMWSGSIR